MRLRLSVERLLFNFSRNFLALSPRFNLQTLCLTPDLLFHIRVIDRVERTVYLFMLYLAIKSKDVEFYHTLLAIKVLEII